MKKAVQQLWQLISERSKSCPAVPLVKQFESAPSSIIQFSIDTGIFVFFIGILCMLHGSKTRVTLKYHRIDPAKFYKPKSSYHPISLFGQSCVAHSMTRMTTLKGQKLSPQIWATNSRFLFSNSLLGLWTQPNTAFPRILNAMSSKYLTWSHGRWADKVMYLKSKMTCILYMQQYMYEHLASAGCQNYTTHSSIGYLQLWRPHKFVSEKQKQQEWNLSLLPRFHPTEVMLVNKKPNQCAS